MHSMRRHTYISTTALLLLGALCPAFSAAAPYLEQEKAVLARIKAPVFPAADFAITDHGAKADSDCSEAIAKAIEACHRAGGGRVVVPKGVWLTGAVRLLSGVNLHVPEGATLRFIPDPKKYLPAVPTRFEGMELIGLSPLIHAAGQENIAITGKGTLDGSADVKHWWPWKGNKQYSGGPSQKADRARLDQQTREGVPPRERTYGEGHYLRPSFVETNGCKNVLIEGVTLVNAPMWVLHPLLCVNVTIRGVTVRSHGPNNDGCDPESCRDVLIEDCVFDTGDDCIAVKSGRNDDGRRVGIPSENIVIRRCVMKDGHGGVTMGSEISGGVRNVFVSDCVMDSPNLDRAFRFKSNAVRGGVIENIRFRDIRLGQVDKAVLGVEFDYEEGADGPHHPVLRDVSFERVTGEACGRVVAIAGLKEATITGIRFSDCRFKGVRSPDLIKEAVPPVMEKVEIERTAPK
jgi:polygalacturonase